jgi:hypothetical protein
MPSNEAEAFENLNKQLLKTTPENKVKYIQRGAALAREWETERRGYLVG